MQAINIVIGFLILVAGGHVYALFAAGAAYLAAVELLPIFGSNIGMRFESHWEIILSGVVCGVIMLFLVSFLDRIPVYLTSAIAGGYLISAVPVAIGYSADWVTLPLQVISGILLLVLVIFSFEFGLVVVSTLSGVTLVVQNLPLVSIEPIAMFLVITIFGLVAQFLLMKYAPAAVE